jgi:hypothetical protein
MRLNHLGKIFQKKCAQDRKVRKFAQSGTDVMIKKKISPKNLAKILAFFA